MWMSIQYSYVHFLSMLVPGNSSYFSYGLATRRRIAVLTRVGFLQTCRGGGFALGGGGGVGMWGGDPCGCRHAAPPGARAPGARAPFVLPPPGARAPTGVPSPPIPPPAPTG